MTAGDHLLEEGRALVGEADAQGLTTRLLGGVGIRLLVGERWEPAFSRPYRDIDLIVGRRDARGLERLIEQRGWEPARQFNALNGARRLLFHAADGDSQIDVFVDSFEMCHALPLADQLASPPPTLPASELLMTKLQIVELNAKDRDDCYALLSAGTHPATAIDVDRIAQLTGRDWGLHHTFELNLDRLTAGAGEVDAPAPARAAIGQVLEALRRAMEAEPKSRGWRMRARVGERRLWYQEVEEVQR